MVDFQPVQPFLPLPTEELCLRLLGQRDESLQVTVANAIGLVAFRQPLRREFADRLQHQETWLVELGNAAQ